MSHGFSLIELIVVITIMAILMVVSIASYQPEAIKPIAFYHDVYSNLRYAQKLAITSGTHVKVTLTKNRYVLEQCDPIAHWQTGVDDCSMNSNFSGVLHPGGSGPIDNTFSQDIISVGASGIMVTFNPHGLAGTSGTTDIGFALPSGPKTIQITNETGFISAL